MTDYFANTRTELLGLLPSGSGKSVLELGCGEGRTGAYLLRSGYGKRVVGIEFNPDAAKIAESNLSAVFIHNLNEPLKLDEKFDVILAADVIEHLVDPWTVVANILVYLKPGGYLLTSTPNIRYWNIIWRLATKGSWEYQDSGILDRTHLRFFTRDSICKLHERCGQKVKCIGYPTLSGKRRLLNRILCDRPKDLLAGQHFVLSRKG